MINLESMTNINKSQFLTELSKSHWKKPTVTIYTEVGGSFQQNYPKFTAMNINKS